jgi:hypothetical protein
MFSSTSFTSRGVIRTVLLAKKPLQTSTILAPAKPREDRANTTGFSVANFIRPSSGVQKCHLDSVRWLKSSPYEVCPFLTLANVGYLIVVASSSSSSAAITATAAPTVLTEPSLAS